METPKVSFMYKESNMVTLDTADVPVEDLKKWADQF